jgi:membrane associated rhomboid family serine protease
MIPIRDDNPAYSPPIVTVALIAANVAVFILQFLQPPELQAQSVHTWGAIPARLLRGGDPAAWLTVFSSMFMHGGIVHLAGNMLYLWIFGNNIEDKLGHLKYLIFYLLCGVAAALGQTLIDPSSEVPMIGASGAISGVLGAYILLFPRANVMVLIIFVFIRFIAVPAYVVLGLWFVMQLSGILGASSSGGGVAFMAHVGGFIFGLATIYLFRPKRDVLRRGWPA